MGYCIDQREAQFNILPSNFAPALAAIKALAGQETISDGSGRHFPWVETKDFLKAETLSQAMDAWRWNLRINEETGEVEDLWFEGEKLGDDEILFNAIAPFVEKGSYIEMGGEDGEVWRWVFDGTKCKEVAAVMAFEADDDE